MQPLSPCIAHTRSEGSESFLVGCVIVGEGPLKVILVDAFQYSLLPIKIISLGILFLAAPFLTCFKKKREGFEWQQGLKIIDKAVCCLCPHCTFGTGCSPFQNCLVRNHHKILISNMSNYVIEENNI